MGYVPSADLLRGTVRAHQGQVFRGTFFCCLREIPHLYGHSSYYVWDGMPVMELRTRINDALKEAMKAKAAERLSTLRLISAAIKDRDIDARASGNENGVSEADLLAILGKMVKQRQESAKVYEEGGRLELAEKEMSEIQIITEFLPKQLSESETQAVIDAAIADTGATSIRDMGKVMGALKAKYTGQIDFGKAGGLIKTRLG